MVTRTRRLFLSSTLRQTNFVSFYFKQKNGRCLFADFRTSPSKPGITYIAREREKRNTWKLLTINRKERTEWLDENTPRIPVPTKIEAEKIPNDTANWLRLTPVFLLFEALRLFQLICRKWKRKTRKLEKSDFLRGRKKQRIIPNLTKTKVLFSEILKRLF